MNIEKFQGIFPAIVTAYDENGGVAPQVQAEFSKWLIDRGCKGVFLCGGTGEGLLLETDERRVLLEATMDAIGDTATVIAHVGSESPWEAYELAEDAAEQGADAIAAVPGSYYLPDEEGLVEHYTRLWKTSDLPTFLYHIPHVTQVEMDLDLLLRMAEIPGVSGMKFTAYDLFTLQQLADERGDSFAILAGTDHQMVPALLMGATGAVGTGYNYLHEIFIPAYEAAAAGDYLRAMEQQRTGNEIIRAGREIAGSIGRCKAAVEALGFEVGPPRAPISQPDAEATEQFLNVLEEHGIIG